MIKDGKLICPEIRIENSSVCDAACIICPREQMTRQRTIMPFHHFTALVNQAKALGAKTISIFGYGEPLLDANVIDKVHYCTKLGLETFITTNTKLLDPDMIFGLIEAGLTNIRFSVHGITRNSYEKVHRGLKWEDTIRNTSNFIAINRMRGKVKTHVSVIPMNDETVEGIKGYWEKHVDYLEIWKPHNWAYGRKYRKANPKKKTCGRPFSGPVQINADGKMMLCCMDYDARMTIGDTYEQSIEEIIAKSNTLNTIQECHRLGIFDDLPCAGCDQLNDGESPLLYSNRDKSGEIGKTSTIKFKLGGT